MCDQGVAELKMEANADEPKQDTAATASTSAGSAPANADVEMKPDAVVSVKDEAAPLEAALAADDADKKPPPKRKKKKKAKQASPNASKKPKKDPNKPEYPKVGEFRSCRGSVCRICRMADRVRCMVASEWV